MTDYQKVYEMLKAINVPFIVSEEKGIKFLTISKDRDDYRLSGIESVSGDINKVEAYCDFYTYYSFDTDGCFLHIGIFE